MPYYLLESYKIFTVLPFLISCSMSKSGSLSILPCSFSLIFGYLFFLPLLPIPIMEYPVQMDFLLFQQSPVILLLSYLHKLVLIDRNHDIVSISHDQVVLILLVRTSFHLKKNLNPASYI
jgi:hypothetical protein